ncbi:peptidoglycan DD-metalloendopeptidase family protein [Desulfoprunum benzoelyticum]|uniref:Septal ring factor EnvC (AmiA/AmiB activator) n=1 Tax=Desulfoprunum benzoelyticum TaxID=1506996 RepID=A0A840UYY4_9BACT|nr:peptidoglycan DD-metalloendopeptidase family protein [Desulfoprunum benzoelyticum]MBB5346720.1 septal ring factor EnvC (AmiA/AmiB activator) [Desulfoprunum benzoelyticum]MBM9529038.1 peptidoglycan DD-metalloendopeptidase family protein [Desulfoprunum benzoelyticum]
MKARGIIAGIRHLPRSGAGPGSAPAPLRPTGLKSVCLLLCSCIVLFALSGAVAREAGRAPKEGVETFRINIQRLQEGIATQQEQYLEATNQEKTLLQELEELDHRLAEQVARLETLEGKLSAQQALITVQELEMAAVRAEKDKVQRHLARRISAYYKMGNIGLLNAIFSAQTLPELLRFQDAFHTLIQYDQNVVVSYRKSIANLERVTRSLVLEKNILSDFIAQTVTEKENIDATKEKKEQLLQHIRTQSKLHRQAITEMEQAATDLTASLLALKKKKEAGEQGFRRRKGALPPPVPGTVITGFNQMTTNALGIKKKSEGIAIESPSGTPVKAIFPGTVIHAGYLRGYGNTIIVHHGFQYYSICSRVEKILAAKGDEVNAGTVIGELGETATLIDKGMYFEIRHRSDSLDPMLWLDTRRLQSPGRNPG